MHNIRFYQSNSFYCFDFGCTRKIGGGKLPNQIFEKWKTVLRYSWSTWKIHLQYIFKIIKLNGAEVKIKRDYEENVKIQNPTFYFWNNQVSQKAFQVKMKLIRSIIWQHNNLPSTVLTLEQDVFVKYTVLQGQRSQEEKLDTQKLGTKRKVLLQWIHIQ